MVVLDKELMIDLLTENIVTITFEKVNGEERIMKCTLIDDIVPGPVNPSQMKEELTATEKKPHQAVWSIDDGGWRSFRWDNMKSFERIADDKG